MSRLTDDRRAAIARRHAEAERAAQPYSVLGQFRYHAVEDIADLLAEVDALRAERDRRESILFAQVESLLAERDAAVARAEQAEAERNTYRRLVDDLIAERDALAKVILEHAPVMTLTAAEDAIVGRALSGEEGPQ